MDGEEISIDFYIESSEENGIQRAIRNISDGKFYLYCNSYQEVITDKEKREKFYSDINKIAEKYHFSFISHGGTLFMSQKGFQRVMLAHLNSINPPGWYNFMRDEVKDFCRKNYLWDLKILGTK